MKILLFTISLLLIGCGRDLLPKDQCIGKGTECHGNETNEDPNYVDQPGQPGPIGPAGKDGKNGTDGTGGTDGINGIDGIDGVAGTNGTNGTDGTDGTSIVQVIIVVVVNRDLAPWSTNNLITLTNDGTIIVPTSFTISTLSGTSGSGWIDFKVGNEVYCYKRVTNTKNYLFSYKKILNAITGCDSDSDKDLNPTIYSTRILSGNILQIIPRDSKMAGIGNILFTFHYFKEQ